MDEHGKYIEDSALKAENIMYGSYDIISYKSINERVIYLGCFIKQWGHFLVDFMPRLWYLIDGVKNCRLAYVSVNNSQIDGVYEDLLNLFGIDSKCLICIKDITKFEDVVVPQTSYDRPNYYYKEYSDIFKHVVERLKKQKLSFPYYEKIYWTRTKLRKAKRTEIGEKQIEQLFKANGYKILSPERLSLLEQVYYFSTCPKMAGISGSIPHNLVFSGSHTEMIIINRTYRINVNQFPINEMCGGKIIYIDAHASFFPNSADKGPFWIVYNENIEKFALDNRFAIPQSILRSRGKVRKKDFNKYCTTYFNTYNGSELMVKDSGIAGHILGRSRPLAEHIEEHEIYYYYRKQFGQIYNKDQIIKAIKHFIKNMMKKTGDNNE